MMHTIRVDRVLRETVKTPYSDLVTRATGRAVRISLRQALAALDGGTAFLDFSSVGLVDFSCADEVVAQLLLENTGTVVVVLGGLREEHSEAIDQVLAHHELAVVVQETPDGPPHLLGMVDGDAQRAFDQLQHNGGVSLADLARDLGWEIPLAERALQALIRLRLIRQDGVRFIPLVHP